MPGHNNLERAAQDPMYRLMYESDRTQEAIKNLYGPPKKEEQKPVKKKAEEAKVICTELHRQGLFDRSDYLLGLRYVREHLTERHERGYHAWAISVVRTMRRSPRASEFWRKLAQARADHIAFVYGDLSRRNRFGALLCAIGHPVCYAIGGFVGEQDWRALYTATERN